MRFLRPSGVLRSSDLYFALGDINVGSGPDSAPRHVTPETELLTGLGYAASVARSGMLRGRFWDAPGALFGMLRGRFLLKSGMLRGRFCGFSLYL